MSACTITHAVRPPVPYTDDAIKAGIANEAANGPSHVRIKALGMMARINGLFEQGKQLGKQLAQAVQDAAHEVKDRADDGKMSVAERVAGLMNRTLTPTAEELAHFDRSKPTQAEEEDEDHPEEQEDEPP